MIVYKTLNDIYLDFFEHDIEPMHEDDFKKLAEAIRGFYRLPSGQELTKLVRRYSDDQCSGIPEMQSEQMDFIVQKNARGIIKWLKEQGF